MSILMATGYVHAMLDKDQDFNDFVMSCARGMGACIMMRDDPDDAPIPEQFEPSDYHAKKRVEAEEELKRLALMTPNEQLEFGDAQRIEEITRIKKSIEERNEAVDKCKAMIAKVESWTPPTEGHLEMKKLMIDQISQSINGEPSTYLTEELKKFEDSTAYGLYNRARFQAEKDVAYHAKGYREEVERTAERNAWLKALRDSLKTPEAS